MTLMWWPRDEAIPAGWRVTKCRPTHHDRYCVLLERIA